MALSRYIRTQTHISSFIAETKDQMDDNKAGNITRDKSANSHFPACQGEADANWLTAKLAYCKVEHTNR